MNQYYLWTDYMPKGLNPDIEPDPKKFFDTLIYQQEDRWSYITDNYQALVNSFQGLNTSFGYQFKLYRESTGNNVFGVIEYVFTGSPADSAYIKRGDIFISINNTRLNMDNYQNLLFGVESYTIGFAEVSNGELVSNGIVKYLTAVAIQEDPVFLSKVLNVGGENIGYLVYLQFISNYNDELRNVFHTFKLAGINDLILDLRYNPGGSVNTAQIMASMIAPQQDVSGDKVFAKYLWNKNVGNQILKDEGADSPNLILKFLSAEMTNNLNLSRVYILTTGNTASASELVINGLKPYMEVVTVGSTTVGKYTASVTFHDQAKSYNWAIQPIVVKLANADDQSDYKNGFEPDYAVQDDYSASLGSLYEDVLAKTISVITGIPVDQLARKAPESSILQNSIPLYSATTRPIVYKQNMYIDSFPN